MMANEMFNYLVPDVLYDSLDDICKGTWRHCYERIAMMSPVKAVANANDQFIDRTEHVGDYRFIPEFEDRRCSVFLAYGKPNEPVAPGTAMLSITDDATKIGYVVSVLEICFMNDYPKKINCYCRPYNYVEEW